jgi:hypothetical protein
MCRLNTKLRGAPEIHCNGGRRARAAAFDELHRVDCGRPLRGTAVDFAVVWSQPKTRLAQLPLVRSATAARTIARERWRTQKLDPFRTKRTRSARRCENVDQVKATDKMHQPVYDPSLNAWLSTVAAALPVVVLLGAIAMFAIKARIGRPSAGLLASSVDSPLGTRRALAACPPCLKRLPWVRCAAPISAL